MECPFISNDSKLDSNKLGKIGIIFWTFLPFNLGGIYSVCKSTHLTKVFSSHTILVHSIHLNCLFKFESNHEFDTSVYSVHLINIVLLISLGISLFISGVKIFFFGNVININHFIFYFEAEFFSKLGNNKIVGSQFFSFLVEEKFSKYERSKQAEIEQIIKTHGEERVKMEKELKDSLESNIKQFKANLVQSLQNGPNKSYIQEKENLQNNLKVLYQRKFEEKAKEINKDFEKQNKKVEMQEIQKVSQELRTEEEDLTEQYEMKLHVNFKYFELICKRVY